MRNRTDEPASSDEDEKWDISGGDADKYHYRVANIIVDNNVDDKQASEASTTSCVYSSLVFREKEGGEELDAVFAVGTANIVESDGGLFEVPLVDGSGNNEKDRQHAKEKKLDSPGNDEEENTCNKVGGDSDGCKDGDVNSNDEEELTRKVLLLHQEMGFPIEESRVALVANNFDVDGAIGSLLGDGQRPEGGRRIEMSREESRVTVTGQRDKLLWGMNKTLTNASRAIRHTAVEMDGQIKKISDNTVQVVNSVEDLKRKTAQVLEGVARKAAHGMKCEQLAHGTKSV